MKKFLSLVLALVMTMSLVTISAGAKDFTDDSKITYGEAVNVISALKVVDGYPDGSFNPTATLTRGAAAKIICNMILGPTTAGALQADVAPYKDVPANSTFAGYIAFCAKEGIISGYSDGTFKPGNTLTGYAFMKMLLGALGYDKAIEGYDGNNWSINVAKQALAIGLTDDLEGDFNGVKPVTREEAALYAFNTLLATMVEYDNKSTITVGDITISSNSKAEPVMSAIASASNFNPSEVDGTLHTLQFAEKSFPKLGIANETKYGHENRYFTVDGQRVSDNKATDKTLATVMSASDFTDLYTKGNKDYVGFEAAATVKLYINGAVQNGGTAYSSMSSLDSAIGATYEKKGVIIEFIDTSSPKDNKYDAVNVIKKAVYTLTADPSTKEVKNNDTQVKVPGIAGMGGFTAANTVKNVFGYEDLKKGDVVLVAPYAVTGGTEYFIEKAEVVEGVVSGLKTGKPIMNGEDYSTSELTNASNVWNNNYVDTYKFYLDNDENVVKAEKVTDTASTDYAYVLQSNYVDVTGGTLDANKYAQARLLKMDGTVEVVTVSKIDGSKAVKTVSSSGEILFSAADNYFVTYKVVDGKYELTKKSNATTTSAITGNRSDFVSSLVGNNSTVLLVNTKTASDPKMAVYTGVTNMPSVSSTTVHYLTDGGYVKFAYVNVLASAVTGASSDYVYIPGTGSSYTTKSYTYVPESKANEGDDYYLFDAIVNGVPEQLKVKALTSNVDTDGNTTADTNLAVNTLYKLVSKDSDGYVTLMTTSGLTQKTGIEAVGDTLKVDTAPSGTVASYKINANSMVYYIAKDGVVTEMVAADVTKDLTDKVYVTKTSSDGLTAEVVYVLETISATPTLLGYTYSINGVETEVTGLQKTNGQNNKVTSLTVGDVVTITAVETLEGSYTVSGNATVTADGTGTGSVTVTVAAEDGTTTGTVTLLFANT